MSFYIPYTRNSDPIDVAVVGASGTVGQKVLALSTYLPWMRITEIAASDARANAPLSSCPWREALLMPQNLSSLRFCTMDDISAPYVLSCLPHDVAEIYEPLWAERGHHVFSNASTFRMSPEIPLLIPEINAHHLSLIHQQKTPGKRVNNPNCSATALACTLAPIMVKHPVRHISIVTLQSISGAGYPGVSSMDIVGNTIPHIPGEAPKIVVELQKILGSEDRALCTPITVNVHRVPVVYGHAATLHILLDRPVCDVADVYLDFNEKHPIFHLYSSDDRPQALRDLSHNDMRVHIGPIRASSLGRDESILRMNIVSHNLVRGAAGAVLANLACFLNASPES
ncbi:MAG: aspartate-semialdehyde dehydrogenase [Alphaproteobacteria bacterium]|nr:aspartate-semialdehyde dehydrogenase [Alphaproteobacteria bacterium]